MEKKNTKVLLILIAIIIIVGTIMIFTKGLKFELQYQDSKKVELNLGKEFERKDIKEITDEIFKGQQVLIQEIELYKDSVSITTSEITEEQKENLIKKINEKYSKEYKVENVTVEQVAHVRGRDIIKPYIVPFVISSLIILVYIIVRYYKLNILKVIVKTVGIIALAQMVLLGIIAITRMPIGNFTIPAVIFVYMFSLYISTTIFEQELENIVVEEN